ncbi:MAG: IclR family transcriptional regulator [Thermoleophilia bacterium]
MATVRDSNSKQSADKRDRNSVQSVEKALSLLCELGNMNQPASPAQLAEACNLSSTASYRLLRALEKGRAVERLPTGKYVLGFLPHELATSFDRHAWLKAAAILPLLRVRGLCNGETVGLYVRINFGQFTCIEYVPGLHPIQHEERLYRPIDIARGGSSLVFLADTWSRYPQGVLESYLSGLPEGIRPDSYPKKLEQIIETKVNGYAVSCGNRIPGVGGLAVPVLGRFGQLLAVLILSAPANRLNESATTWLSWLPHMKAAAEAIANGIYGQGPPARGAGSQIVATR